MGGSEEKQRKTLGREAFIIYIINAKIYKYIFSFSLPIFLHNIIYNILCRKIRLYINLNINTIIDHQPSSTSCSHEADGSRLAAAKARGGLLRWGVGMVGDERR